MNRRVEQESNELSYEPLPPYQKDELVAIALRVMVSLSQQPIETQLPVIRFA